MKIFLIYPPIRPKMEMQISMGCLALEAYLRPKGREVDVYRGEFFDITVFAEQIRRSKSDILGMTCDCSNMDYCFTLAETVKQIDKTIFIILGGPQATFLHKLILERIPWIDAVVRGEGEETFAETVDRCEERKESVDLIKVKGLSYRSDGEIIVNEDRPVIRDLDLLPLPEKNMVKRYARLHENISVGKKLFFLETGRGCPYACYFCNDVGVWKRVVRQKSVERIVEEIIFFKKYGKAGKILLRENTFTLNRLRVIALCQSLIRNKVNIEWEAETRVDCVDKDLLMIMKEAGCRRIGYGVESLSDTMLKLMGKGFTSRLAMNVLEETQRLGFRQDYNILLGFPGETEKTLAETFSRIKKLGRYGHPSGVNLFQFHPGSRLYVKMKQQGLISDEMWFNDARGMAEFSKKFHSADFQQTLSFYEQEIRRLRRLETFSQDQLK